MKKFALVSAILGVLSLGLAIYQHFVIVENAAIAEVDMKHGLDTFRGDDIYEYYETSEYQESRATYELKTDMGIVTLFVGLAVFLVGVVPVIKKQKLGWIGIIGGLASILIGLAYGTHMFS